MYKIREYDGVKISDRSMLMVMWALKVDGLNVFPKKWTPNVLTYSTVVLVSIFWVVVVSNFFRKASSEAGLEFPEDIHFLYIIAGMTNGMLQAFFVINRNTAIRQIYNSIFVKFDSWIDSEEKMAAYRKKAFVVSNWVTFSGTQLYVAVFSMMLRPLSDGSDFPLPRSLVMLPGVDYDTQPAARMAMYAIQLVLMIQLSGLLFTTDSMFMVMMAHISGHLHLLGEELEAAGHSGNQGTVRRGVRVFVDRYNAIHRCLNRLRYVYGPQNFYLPLYTMAFSTITLLAFDGTMGTVSCLALAVSHMFRLLTFCYPAEKVLTESEVLYRRMMWSGFETWPVKQQKNMLFILQRLNKPLGMKCGLHGTFSMELFYSTMSTIYSLYNTFSRFKKRK